MQVLYNGVYAGVRASLVLGCVECAAFSNRAPVDIQRGAAALFGRGTRHLLAV